MSVTTKTTPPVHGQTIEWRDGKLTVPDHPILPFIEGDGTGPDIWRASKLVFDAAVAKTYSGKRSIAWLEVLAGEKAKSETGEWLPDETVEAMRKYRCAIKGPLTTPVGGGIRSLNVALRQILDLYACVRPVRYFDGVPSPVKQPEKVNMVIFRENTEDVYAGIEWKSGSAEAKKLIRFLADEFGSRIREDSGIGIKPVSAFGSKRLVRKAIQYALDERPRQRDPGAQGQHHEVHRGRLQRVGLRAGGRGVRRPHGVRGRDVGEARRQAAEGQDPDQGPHRRLDVPAGAAAPRRVLDDRHHQPQRRLHVRRAGGAGRRPRPGARLERGRRHRGVRGDPRHRAQVRRPGQGQPGVGHPLRRDDARAGWAGRRRRRTSRARCRAPSRRSASPTTSSGRCRAPPCSRPPSSARRSSTTSSRGAACLLPLRGAEASSAPTSGEVG